MMKVLLVLGLLAVFFQTDATSLLMPSHCVSYKGGSFPGSIARRGRGGSISNDNNDYKCKCGSTEQNGVVNVGGVANNLNLLNCNQDLLSLDKLFLIALLDNIAEICAKGGEECSDNGCIVDNLDLDLFLLGVPPTPDNYTFQCCKEANCLDQTCSSQTHNTTDSGSYSDCCIACSNEDACSSDVSVFPIKLQ